MDAYAILRMALAFFTKKEGEYVSLDKVRERYWFLRKYYERTSQ